MPAFIVAMKKEIATFSSVTRSMIEESDALPKEIEQFSDVVDQVADETDAPLDVVHPFDRPTCKSPRAFV